MSCEPGIEPSGSSCCEISCEPDTVSGCLPALMTTGSGLAAAADFGDDLGPFPDGPGAFNIDWRWT